MIRALKYLYGAAPRTGGAVPPRMVMPAPALRVATQTTLTTTTAMATSSSGSFSPPRRTLALCTVRLPPLPDSYSEALIVKVHARPGDWVREDQLIVEADAKFYLNIQAPRKGRLTKVYVHAQQVVPRDAPLFEVKTNEFIEDYTL